MRNFSTAAVISASDARFIAPQLEIRKQRAEILGRHRVVQTRHNGRTRRKENLFCTVFVGDLEGIERGEEGILQVHWRRLCSESPKLAPSRRCEPARPRERRAGPQCRRQHLAPWVTLKGPPNWRLSPWTYCRQPSTVSPRSSQTCDSVPSPECSPQASRPMADGPLRSTTADATPASEPRQINFRRACV
jgi:hypothetical protein